ncbi:unnamed protein product [Darwinula stevensoni]|uniref:Uncharacterized protein n=1 Tax=Darwinula stevensoni TaxID=69355 RepID=A0A7R9AGZ7_9CRUS|nr:unnamed protein product [Darwinula stevensoni]CAG0904598.1 unnamed protein product [Darwinula stevensoni]
MEEGDHTSSLEVSAASGSLLDGEIELNPSDRELRLLQLGAEILKRPIVLIGKKLSYTFFPQGAKGDENEDYRGILLYAQEDNLSDSILPVVPQTCDTSWFALRLCNSLPPITEGITDPTWSPSVLARDMLCLPRLWWAAVRILCGGQRLM